MNQSCYALVGKETHPLLVYFYTLNAVDRLKHKASGAVFDAITTRDFESEQIMKLSDDDAKAFLCIAEPMLQKVLNNCIENLRLSTLRDSLLPKLMSGEIDVSRIGLRQLNGHLVRLRTLVIVSRSTVYCMRAPFVG